MSSPAISFTYSGSAVTSEQWLHLEQEAVPTGALSLLDLTAMISLARSGVSAKSYIAQSCPATLVDGVVVVPLAVYVWPSDDAIQYRLDAAIPSWTTIGDAVAVETEREFDLVIPMATTVDLPTLCRDLSITWQSPAITSRGQVVDRPDIMAHDIAYDWLRPYDQAAKACRLHLDREVFGVLRVRCTAIGYRHDITMRIPKDGSSKVDNIKEVISATWTIGSSAKQTVAEEISLPGCVSTILEACDNSSTVPRWLGEVKDEDDLVPQVRYNTCTGRAIGIVKMVKATKR